MVSVVPLDPFELCVPLDPFEVCMPLDPFKLCMPLEPLEPFVASGVIVVMVKKV